MNINNLLNENGLKPLSMRAWLQPCPATGAAQSVPGWQLECDWSSDEEKPALRDLELCSAELSEGLLCLALTGRGTRQRVGDKAGIHELTVVWLLNPADTNVWQAIESWLKGAPVWGLNAIDVGSTFTASSDLAALEAREREGEELESDLLAGTLIELMKQGQLEAKLACELGISGAISIAIVESPMLCKSFEPVDPELWAAHVAHEENNILRDDSKGYI